MFPSKNLTKDVRDVSQRTWDDIFVITPLTLYLFHLTGIGIGDMVMEEHVFMTCHCREVLMS